MKTKINGLSVNTFGNPQNKEVIFVHGFPYDHLMWKNQYEFLSESYYCVAYDIRGLGESDVGDGQYTMELFVDDLFKIIGELKLKKPAVCGLSMGGYLTLQALQRNQEIFSAVILADTHPMADDKAGKLKRSNAIKAINTEGLASYVDSFVPGTFSPETQTKKPDYFKETLARCKANNPLGVKGSQIAMLSRFSSVGFLPEIKLPTLLLVGEEDSLTPPEVMSSMAVQIPNSEFYIIPKAGHMSPLENPAEFNLRLKEFLDKHLT
jgi:3-oxoadipate enol-lactonase